MAAALMCAYLRDDLAGHDAMARLERFAEAQGFGLATTVHASNPHVDFDRLSAAVANADCQHVVVPSKEHLSGVRHDQLERLRGSGVWIWYEEQDGGGAR